MQEHPTQGSTSRVLYVPVVRGSLRVSNPAYTYDYVITPAAIAAQRVLNLPLITGTDTLATLGLAATFTAAQTFTGGLSADGKLRPSTGTPDSKTVAAGVITYAKFYTRLEPESAPTDDLDTINGGAEGDMLLLNGPASGANTVVVKDGTGNIQINANCSLAGGSNQNHILLMLINGAWRELFRISYA